MSLDPNLEEMRRQAYLAVDRAVEHLASLDQLPVARLPKAEVLQPLVAEALPEQPIPISQSLDRLFQDLMPQATLVNHPRFFAYIPGPGSFHGALGEWLAAATNTFVGTWLGGAVMTQLEIQVLDWLRQSMGLPAGFTGILTSGGSMANLCALAAARTRISDLTKARLYVSPEAHYSLAKAGRLLGLNDQQILSLDARAMGPQIRQDRQAGLQPMAVVATFGGTATGSMDPLPELAELCAKEQVWLHVDAAYGAALALLPEWRSRCAGMNSADSITLDPHKWFYAPFESGCLLTRHPQTLQQTFTGDADYLQDIPRDEVNFFERGPELSRGNRALKLWLLWRSVGLDAIRQAIRKDLELCRLAHDLLAKDPRIRIVTEPSMSVFTFSVEGDAAKGKALVQDILDDGYLMLSSCLVQGEFALRFCVVNHRSTEQDVRSSVERILQLLDQPL